MMDALRSGGQVPVASPMKRPRHRSATSGLDRVRTVFSVSALIDYVALRQESKVGKWWTCDNSLRFASHHLTVSPRFCSLRSMQILHNNILFISQQFVSSVR